MYSDRPPIVPSPDLINELPLGSGRDVIRFPIREKL
jgi:hypothetical protein